MVSQTGSVTLQLVSLDGRRLATVAADVGYQGQTNHVVRRLCTQRSRSMTVQAPARFGTSEAWLIA